MKTSSSPLSPLPAWRRRALLSSTMLAGAVLFTAPANATNCNASDTASLAACNGSAFGSGIFFDSFTAGGAK